MMRNIETQLSLYDCLKPDNNEKLYLFFDAASMNELPGKVWELEGKPQIESLFDHSAETFFEQSPFIVQLDIDSPLTAWVIDEWEDKPIGFFIKSQQSLEQLVSIYQSRIQAKTEDDKTMLFRFYDPRVMQAYLQSTDQKEVQWFWQAASSLVIWDYYLEKHRQNDFICYHNEEYLISSGETLKPENKMVKISQQKEFEIITALLPFKILKYLKVNFSELLDQQADAQILKTIRDDYIPRTKAAGFYDEGSIGLLSSLSLTYQTVFEKHPMVKTVLGKGEYKTLKEGLRSVDQSVWENMWQFNDEVYDESYAEGLLI